MVEIVAAALGLIYIFLEYRANAWMWLFSIAMSVLYSWVFFSQNMYANLLLSIYNIGVSVWGVRSWLQHKDAAQGDTLILTFPRRWMPLLIGVIVVLVPLLAWVLKLMGETEAPLLDGLTASLSVVGIWMLAKRYRQQWLCWIVADILYVVMFAQSGMWPSLVLYAVYVGIAILGYRHWIQLEKNNQDSRK